MLVIAPGGTCRCQRLNANISGARKMPPWTNFAEFGAAEGTCSTVLMALLRK